MKKNINIIKIVLMITLLCCTGVAWVQTESSRVDLQNEAEVIIALTKSVNLMIMICEHDLSFEMEDDEDKEENLLYHAGVTVVHNLALDIRSNLASMSHSERVYYMGVLSWFFHATGTSWAMTTWGDESILKNFGLTGGANKLNNPTEVIIAVTEKIDDVMSLYDKVFKKNILRGTHDLDINTIKYDERPYYWLVDAAHELILEIEPLVARMNHHERIYCLGILTCFFYSIGV